MSPRTHLAARAALAAACALFSAAAAAQTPATDPRSERLEHYRAACVLNRPNANVQACVEETLAARQAASRGQLADDNETYRHNALMRCRALPAAEQPACEARVRGVGTTSGSVEEGGILRELVVRERGEPGAEPASAEPAQLRMDPNADGLSDTVPAEPSSPYGPRLPR